MDHIFLFLCSVVILIMFWTLWLIQNSGVCCLPQNILVFVLVSSPHGKIRTPNSISPVMGNNRNYCFVLLALPGCLAKVSAHEKLRDQPDILKDCLNSEFRTLPLWMSLFWDLSSQLVAAETDYLQTKVRKIVNLPWIQWFNQ